MGVYIRGMQMPENCSECPVALSGKYCRINKTNATTRVIPIRPEHCPLVELPEHHGRLIDADTLEPDADYDDGEFWAYSIMQVRSAQTIVEAE